MNVSTIPATKLQTVSTRLGLISASVPEVCLAIHMKRAAPHRMAVSQRMTVRRRWRVFLAEMALEDVLILASKMLLPVVLEHCALLSSIRLSVHAPQSI
jgi:hypothetical protein